MYPAADTYINNLRIRGRGTGMDPLSARLRVQSLLSSVNFRPPGLPSHAFLCVRRLSDPKPGRLRLGTVVTLPSRDWEEAVTDSIDRIVRRAARPAAGLVPADAEAVVFQDRAELLACLAADWCDGNVLTRWWWRSVFRTMDVTRAVLKAWLDTPEYVPAALEHLAKQRRVMPFVNRLSLVESKMLLNRIVHRFGLYALESEIASILDKGGRDSGPMESGTDHSAKDGPEAGRSPESSFAFTQRWKPPWNAWVLESTGADADFVQQCLAGIGLMLIRGPTVVRSDSFAHAVGEWLRAGAPDKDSTRQFATLTPSVPRFPAAREAASEEVGETKGRGSQEGMAQSASTWLQGDRRSIRGESRSSERMNSPLVTHEQGSQNTEKLASADTATDDEGSSPRIVPAKSWVGDFPGVPPFEESVDTEYGGVFYLINLGIFLGLYGDFTAPGHRGISLSIWDFVALVGRQIVGEDIRGDSAWLLLSRLDGRTQDQEPGRDFIPPEQWRLPGEWLRPFPLKSNWKWNLHRGRLMVEHPDGFPVLDLEGEEESITQGREAIEDYRAFGAFDLDQDRFLEPIVSSSALDRWMGWITPYIKARLKKALGLTESDDIRNLLFNSPARVTVTSTHLDVFFSLRDLPIEVRLSGLDRNPGWVPAAGRYIQFHFV
jgi:hypothetical protein